MNLSNSNPLLRRERKSRLSYDLVAFILVIIGSVLALGYLLSPAGSSIRAALTSLFALTTDQAMWYITRAAGMMAYLLLWLSTVWGLAIPAKLLGDKLSGEFTFDFHQFISLFIT